MLVYQKQEPLLSLGFPLKSVFHLCRQNRIYDVLCLQHSRSYIWKKCLSLFMSFKYLFNPTFPSLSLVIVTSKALVAFLHQSHSPKLPLIKHKKCLLFPNPRAIATSQLDEILLVSAGLSILCFCKLYLA